MPTDLNVFDLIISIFSEGGKLRSSSLYKFHPFLLLLLLLLLGFKYSPEHSVLKDP